MTDVETQGETYEITEAFMGGPPAILLCKGGKRTLIAECKNQKTAERIVAMYKACEGWTTSDLNSFRGIVVSKRTGLPKGS